MAVKTYGKIGLTGGASGDLDAVDGSGLIDGDRAIVFTPSNAVYFYRLDADSGLSESSPDIISPGLNAGNKRWILQEIQNAQTEVVNDTTPQLGGNLDMNGKSIAFEFGTLASDHAASGIVVTATAGEAVSFGDVCYFKSDAKFWQADADAESTAKGLLAMAIASISAGSSGLFLIRGLARDDSWSWTTGDELYLSTTAAAMTATRPSGTGDIVRIVGYAIAADYVWFDPDRTYVEVV